MKNMIRRLSALAPVDRRFCRRVLCMVMALTMVFTMVPPTRAVAPTIVEGDEYGFGANIGKTATFGPFVPIPVTDAPETVTSPYGTQCQQIFTEELPENALLMVIVDYYYSLDADLLFYKVEAAPGYTLPDKLQQYPWVFQDTVKEPYGEGYLILSDTHADYILDGNGNLIDPTEELTLPQNEKFSLQAASTLPNVSYQWQIRYDAEEDLWVNIHGQTNSWLSVSYSLVSSLLDEDDRAYLRYKVTAVDGSVSTSDVLTVTVVPSAEPMVGAEFVTSDGDPVYVTVYGNVPSDAALELLEADADDITPMVGHQVLLALDISVRNTNGTEWQPAPGESVTVTVPAAQVGLEPGDYYAVYHVHNDEMRLLGPFLCSGENLLITVDGFSKFYFAQVAVSDATREDYLSNVGKHAVVNELYDVLWVSDDPASIEEYSGQWFVSADMMDVNVEFEIVDVYVSPVAPNALWYRVAAATGYVLPEVIEQNPWVYQDYLAEGWSGVGSLDLFDALPPAPACTVQLNGEPVESLNLAAGQKVGLTAAVANLPGDYITWQWQILMQQMNKWIPINGETSADLAVSGAVVNSLAVDGVAYIRCVASNGTDSVSSATIAVNIVAQPAPPSEPSDTKDETVYKVTDDTVVIPDVVLGEETFETTDDLVYNVDPDTVIIPGVVGGETTEDPAEDTTEDPAGKPAGPGKPEKPGKPEEPAKPEKPAKPETPGKPAGPAKLTAAAPAVYAQPLSLRSAGNQSRAGEGSSIKHAIEYRYVFENGTTAAQSYYAEVEDGESISIGRIDHPPITGYLPYDKNGNRTDYVEAATYEDVTEGVTVVITYKPTNVNFTVIHYQQNIYDDGYVELPHETRQGLTNSTVGNVANTYEGFYALIYEHPTIAADGSTVVEIYYDRNYYLMFFDCAGGYGVEPIYARYGTLISIGTPQQAGWNFNGWDNPVPDTVPAENRVFTAQWTPVAGDRRYTIVYWAADLDDGNPTTPTTYSYFGMREKTTPRNTVLVPSTVGANNIIDGKDVYGDDVPTGDNAYLNETLYFEYDAAATADKNPDTVTVADNGTTIINVYYKRKIFEIRYNFARSRGRDYYIANDTKTGVYNNWSTVEVNDVPGLKAEYRDDYTIKSEVREDGYTYHYIAVRAEYGANIEEQWPAAAIATASNNYKFGSWGAEDGTHYRGKDPAHANIVGFYPYMSAEMIRTANVNAPVEEKDEVYYVAQRMSAWWDPNIQDHTYHIYLQLLDGEKAPAGVPTEVVNGKRYQIITSRLQCAHNGNTRVDPFFYTGYKCTNDTRYKADGSDNLNQWNDYQANSLNYENTQQNIREGRYKCPETTNKCRYCNVFYYDRISGLNLIFNDQNGEIHVGTGMTFGEALENGAHDTWKPEENYMPRYPDGLEPDAYYFDGWYTTPELYPGTKVDLTSDTMPSSALVLYAGWKKVTRTVEIYPDYSSMLAGTGQIGGAIKILHGERVPDGQIPADPTREGVEFIGWFYRNGEQEVAFDFKNMPVNRDMKVYAKWSSNVLVTYEFRFEDQHGNPVADPVAGSGLVGVTKTQNAKGDLDLYTTYQEGWFPTTTGHSITLVEDAARNIYTFVYEESTAVGYTVRYLEEGTNKVLADPKTVANNRKAVVVELFAPVTGYTPDRISKKLVVTPDGTNEIVFYYTKNTTQAAYIIYHYKEKLDGTFTVHTTQEGLKDFNTTVTAEPVSITGYTYAPAYNSNGNVEAKSGTIQKDKLLELRLYYTLNEYPYEIRWVDQYTRVPLRESEKGKGKFGETVTGLAETFVGYDLLSDASQTTVIRMETGSNALLNVITFEYEELQATVQYLVAGDGGTVSEASETDKVKTGTMLGSTAVAAEDYKFLGWYTDALCTVPVPAEWVDANNKLVPRKGADGMYESATYYAKFEYQVTSLTIQKSAAGDAGETFLFRVSGEGTNIIIAAKHNEPVTVWGVYLDRTYTVTELTDWSWKYDFDKVIAVDDSVVVPIDGQAAANVTIGRGTNAVLFQNTLQPVDWLSGEAAIENKFQ